MASGGVRVAAAAEQGDSAGSRSRHRRGSAQVAAGVAQDARAAAETVQRPSLGEREFWRSRAASRAERDGHRAGWAVSAQTERSRRCAERGCIRAVLAAWTRAMCGSTRVAGGDRTYVSRVSVIEDPAGRARAAAGAAGATGRAAWGPGDELSVAGRRLRVAGVGPLQGVVGAGRRRRVVVLDRRGAGRACWPTVLAVRAGLRRCVVGARSSVPGGRKRGSARGRVAGSSVRGCWIVALGRRCGCRCRLEGSGSSRVAGDRVVGGWLSLPTGAPAAGRCVVGTCSGHCVRGHCVRGRPAVGAVYGSTVQRTQGGRCQLLRAGRCALVRQCLVSRYRVLDIAWRGVRSRCRPVSGGLLGCGWWAVAGGHRLVVPCRGHRVVGLGVGTGWWALGLGSRVGSRVAGADGQVPVWTPGGVHVVVAAFPRCSFVGTGAAALFDRAVSAALVRQPLSGSPCPAVLVRPCLSGRACPAVLVRPCLSGRAVRASADQLTGGGPPSHSRPPRQPVRIPPLGSQSPTLGERSPTVGRACGGPARPARSGMRPSAARATTAVQCNGEGRASRSNGGAERRAPPIIPVPEGRSSRSPRDQSPERDGRARARAASRPVGRAPGGDARWSRGASSTNPSSAGAPSLAEHDTPEVQGTLARGPSPTYCNPSSPRRVGERDSRTSSGKTSFAPRSRRVRPAVRNETRESRRLELLGVSLVGDVRPILENSTACTIVNAKYPRPGGLGRLVEIPLD
jgi:hypothetical protein